MRTILSSQVMTVRMRVMTRPGGHMLGLSRRKLLLGGIGVAAAACAGRLRARAGGHAAGQGCAPRAAGGLRVSPPAPPPPPAVSASPQPPPRLPAAARAH